MQRFSGSAARAVLACALAGVAAMLLAPASASAITTKDDWEAESTVDPANEDGVYSVTLNVADCREQVADAGSETVTFNLVAGSFGTDAEYSVKIAQGNETCTESSLDEEADETCVTEVERETASSLITLDLDFLALSPAKDVDACEGLSHTTAIYLIVEDPGLLDDPADSRYSVSYSLRFDTARPAAPTGITAIPGENSIEVSWTGTGIEDDTYKIYASTSPITTGQYPEDIAADATRDEPTESGQLRGVDVDITYYVAVVTVDDEGNESLVGEVLQVTTLPVDDFWEAVSRDQEIDSGHCFIATAAYGSYQAPHVQTLRTFRDEYLLTNAPGRWFVANYYAYSPRLADAIAGNESLRALTRVALIPLYAGASFMISSSPLQKALVALAFLASIGLIVARRRGRRASGPSRRGPRPRVAAFATAALAALLALLVGVGEARAESPVDMVFEVKMGPYRPDELGATYTEYFGDDSALLFELELDYQLYRGWGSLAIGGSLGYSSVTGSAQTADGEAAVDETSLNWLPLRLAAVYRWDVFWTKWGVPLTLYAKGGLDYYVWWIDDGNGDTAIDDEGNEGSGGTFGYHAVGGIAFVLDWLAPSMASNFDVEWGVNNSYLFAEFLYAVIDDFGSSTALNLSESGTFQIGLALEF